MRSEIGICPVQHEPTVGDDTEVKKRSSRNALVVQAAQDLLDNPAFAEDITGKLHQDLTEHYELMFDYQSVKAAYNVERYTRKAVLGSLLHHAGDVLIERTLPQLRTGKSLLPTTL